MSLARDTYRALEDIVGPENISEEPVILDSYAFQWLGELIPAGKGDRFVIRPEAVVLPGSTEEVQAIVRACNRDKIKFKAFSTGWGVWGGPGSEGVIQLDLRRMNRILEINERNMYAVVEPYVIGARLQAELMKRGLNCHIITAGSNTSALPLTALDGYGFSSVSMSIHPRNVLGIEWVLPTGEILRLGSLGSGAGWFCGDGPGPSLRGIARGVTATTGGLGVFTKAATKVYHWPGPPVPPVGIEGVSPSYTIKPLPRMHSYYVVLPTWEKMVEAGIRIAESEIAFVLVAMGQYQMAVDIATSNEESAKLFSEILESSKKQPCALVIISATSQREFDYREKVLKKILAETGGESLPVLEEDTVQGSVTWRFTRASSGTRQTFRLTGGTQSLGLITNWDILPSVREGVGKKASRKYIRNGLILDDGGDAGLSLSIEYGHLGMSGIVFMYDPADAESTQAAVRLMIESNEIGLEKYRYIVPPITSKDRNTIGPLLGEFHLWQRKIKKAFDPNVASDPTYYINP